MATVHVIDAAHATLDPVGLVEPMRDVFRAVSQERAHSAFALLDLDRGDVHVKAGHVAGAATFTVKVASWVPSADPGATSVAGGAVLVFSAATGAPLALIADGHRLTDARTAAAGALATLLLADGAADHVAVLGAGTQAELQVTTLHALRPLTAVTIWARRAERAQALAARLTERLGVPVSIAASARAAVHAAPIVITTTAATEPIVEGAWLEPGQHITAVGADDSRKRELDDACFARADRVVVDSRRQTCAQAELASALAAGAVAAGEVVELGEILLGTRPGRRTPAEITIATLTGLAAQDVRAAEQVLG